ncbi:MAG: tetratricopeptide repeat protein [Bacteroidetes bacterium]|nr:MAG: tetratricopeptide repeat protein [Bacteroidota bacterium]
MRKACLLLLFVCSLLRLTAHTDTDSLRAVWNDPGQPDTNRLKAIQAMAWRLVFNNPDSARLLAQQELDFARKTGHYRWQGKALNVIGATYDMKGNFPAALEHYQNALTAMKAAGDKKGIAAILNNIGLIYRNMGNGPLALQYYQQDLDMQRAMQDQQGIGNAYINIGNIYSDQENNRKALEYYEKAKAIYGVLEYKHGLGILYNNIGANYNSLGNPEEALIAYQKSLEIRRDLQDWRSLAIVLLNMGLVYKDQGKYDQALRYYREGLDIQEQLDDKHGLANTYFNLGQLYGIQDNHIQALKWCRKGLVLSQAIGAIRQERNACACLYDSYKSFGNSSQALVYHERYMLLDDSLQQEETNDRLQQLEFNQRLLSDSLSSEAEKHQLEMRFLEKVRQKDRTRNILLVAGLVVLALAVGSWSRMLYFRRYSEVFQNKAKNLEKQQLLSEIALLRAQVNPHFLFNSLNILSSLVYIDPTMSEQFIDRLSRSYRYILEQRDASLVSLRTELDFIRSYAFLLKIRFEHKFDLRIELPDAEQDCYQIAPLTLQLLVENVVKHNRMSAQAPLSVVIRLKTGPTLEISNNLQPRPAATSSTGLGLQNIRNRYALLTDRPVRTGERDGKFIVEIPLLT